ncbi:MAG: hypothetical protein AVDCRST_MAG77-214 [uncultured Chloroflexi bacterium]|uniref:Uncharacterized protein n=1 Tax=uncultured Chloroflexota bacterium TaxID=166587 RepID=A0A6J4HAR6_9CHLR|nr:MAG: hypothetical protein AVDCRST_MAG77-214 [uncultured Chloroflexota bacterium]
MTTNATGAAETAERAGPRRPPQMEWPDVLIYPDRAVMGAAAAEAGADALRRAIAEKGGAGAGFASAPSQEEFLGGLAGAPGIDWSRDTAFHLDEHSAALLP